MQYQKSTIKFLKRLIERLNRSIIIYKFSQKEKILVFLIFIVISTIGVYLLTSNLAEEIVFAPAIAYFVLVTVLFIGYVFKPIWLVVSLFILVSISLLIDVIRNPIDPIEVYDSLVVLNGLENELVYDMISQLAPQFLKYQFYFLLAGYLVFEIALMILNKIYKKLGFKLKRHPLKVRAYFLITLIFINLALIMIFE